MKVGSGGNLGLCREYPKKLFWPVFYSWWDCPLSRLDVKQGGKTHRQPSPTALAGKGGGFRRVIRFHPPLTTS